MGNEKMYYDLHVHTTASDGLFTPCEVVLLARCLGLRGIAITDHDTAGGLREGVACGRDLGIDVIPGVEFNTASDGKEVHILGYFVDPDSPALTSRLEVIREAREARGRKIVEKLNKMGIAIDWEEARAKARGEVVGRPHIAMVMIEHGYGQTIDEIFRRYIGEGAPAYVPRYHFTPEEGVQLIAEAGGIPVIAHPGLIGDEELVRRLLAYVGGVEADYPEHDEVTVARYRELARERGLLVTGGSDFHGTGGIRSQMARCRTQKETVEMLRIAAARQRNKAFCVD